MYTANNQHDTQVRWYGNSTETVIIKTNIFIYLSTPLETVLLSPPASHFPPNICALFVKIKTKTRQNV